MLKCPCASIREVARLFEQLRAAIRAASEEDATSVAGSVPHAPSPRGALGVADGSEGPPATATAASRTGAAAAAAAWAAPQVRGQLARLSPGLTSSMLGSCQLAEHIYMAPRRALRSASLLHALRVGQIVYCAIEPPTKGAHGGLHEMHSAPPHDAEQLAAISRLVDKGAAVGRTTLLVGDEAMASCAELAAALLEAREHLSKFDAALRVRQLVVTQ